MLDELKIKPTRYSVKLGRKGVGICAYTGKEWVFMCQIDGQMYKGATPELAIAKCKELQHAALDGK